MVAVTAPLVSGLRVQLGRGSADLLRAAGSFCLDNFRELPHFQQKRGFQSDQNQRQGPEGRQSEASSAGPTALSVGGPYAARLFSRKVVRFDGPEVIQFLQVWAPTHYCRFLHRPREYAFVSRLSVYRTFSDCLPTVYLLQILSHTF